MGSEGQVKRDRRLPALLGLAAVAMFAVRAEAKIIEAWTATQDGNWNLTAGGTMKGCMTTSAPGAELSFAITTAERGIYRLFVRVVKAGDAGYMKVRIDDDFETELHAYSRSNITKSIFARQCILSKGKHTVKIVNAGKKHAELGGNHLYVLGLDVSRVYAQKGTGQFQVGQQIEAEECTAINGSWALSRGSQLGAMMSKAKDAWMEFTVDVPKADHYQLDVLVYKEVDGGIMGVAVDGRDVKEIDTHAPKRTHTWLHVGDLDLPVGKHTVRVAVTGKQNKLSPDCWLYVDALRLGRKIEDVVFRFADLDFKPYGGWFNQPSSGARTSKGRPLHFIVEDTGKGMGWRARLARTVNVSETPYAVLRYRASGNVGPCFTIRLLGTGGTKDRPIKELNVVVSGDLAVRNKERQVVKRMREKFTATGIAVGLKSQFDRADLWLDSIEFRVAKPKEKISDALAFRPLKVEEASGHKDFLLVDVPARAHKEPFSIPAATDDCGLFSHPAIMVENIPFRLTAKDRVPETGARWKEQKPLEVDIPAAAREIFLLIWAKVPVVDGHAGPGHRPIGVIDQSERFTIEAVSEAGQADFFIPYNVLEEQYGLKRGLYLYVIHPEEGSVPKRLIFHDKMGSCSSSFALVALTCNKGAPVSPEPKLGGAPTWYPALRKKSAPVKRKIEVKLEGSIAGLSDGIVTAELDLSEGLKWQRLEAPVYGKMAVAQTPLFSVGQGDKWSASDEWRVLEKKPLNDGISVVLEHKNDKHSLRATLTMRVEGAGKLKVSLALKNTGDADFMERVKFPIIEGVKLGSAEDTWYYFAPVGGAMIHHVAGSVYGSHGYEHPLQVEAFFNPREWFALTLLSNDVKGVFRWYDVGKKRTGGWYRLEYLERRLKPGATQTFPEPIVAVSPGDWHAGFNLYRQWISTWYKPKPKARNWYRKSFVLGSWRSSEERKGVSLVEQAMNARRDWGYCDAMRMYNWNIRDGNRSYWSGEYDRRAVGSLVGGEEGFRALIRKAEAAGVGVDTYTDPILVHEASYHGSKKVREWGIGPSHGDTWYTIDAGTPAYRPCLAVKEWQDYMVGCAKYLTRDIGASILYLDETGYGARVCYRLDHPHDSPEPHYYGERELVRRIRAVIPEDVPICSENQPEDTRIQYQDGTHSGVYRQFLRRKKWIQAPANMVRFAFPDFKIFSLMYGYSLKSGNYELLKFLIFNGDGLYHSRSYGIKDYYDEDSINLTRKIFRILHENADAFASDDVEPLVPTEMPGVFANRFAAEKKVVWTLYNANYRTVRGTLLRVNHVPNAKYVNLWDESSVDTRIHDDSATLSVQMGPREVGCIAQLVE